MLILGFLGSPRVNGNCAKLLMKALEGAESKGAHTKRYDLIKCNIKYCRSCFKCIFAHHELPIGKCPLNDDMASLLEEYIKANGYIFASPVYDGYITSLMKTFLERKMPLTFRDKDAYGKISAARNPAHFKKMVSMIVTGNCGDEFREVMGDPCFEAMEGLLAIEQVPTVDKLYAGGIENMSKEAFLEKLNIAYQTGIHLVEEIEKAQKASES